MNNEPLCFSGTFKAATLQLSLGEYTTFAIRSQFPRSEEHVPLKFQSCVNIFLGNIEPFHGKTCQKSVFCQCWLPFQLLLWISEMVLLDDFPEEVASSPSLSVQLLSHVRLFEIPWTAARQASLSITNSRSPPKPMSIESMRPSNHLILCRPLLLLPSIFPSIRVFSNESGLCIG